MAAIDTNESLSSSPVFEVVQKLWADVLADYYSREPVTLGELILYIPYNRYQDKEIKVGCGVCIKEYDLGVSQWDFHVRDEERNLAWLVEHIERLYYEHRHDGSNVKSAGKQ